MIVIAVRQQECYEEWLQISVTIMTGWALHGLRSHNRVQAMTSQTFVNPLGCLGHSIWHIVAHTLINENM